MWFMFDVGVTYGVCSGRFSWFFFFIFSLALAPRLNPVTQLKGVGQTLCRRGAHRPSKFESYLKSESLLIFSRSSGVRQRQLLPSLIRYAMMTQEVIVAGAKSQKVAEH